MDLSEISYHQRSTVLRFYSTSQLCYIVLSPNASNHGASAVAEVAALSLCDV